MIFFFIALSSSSSCLIRFSLLRVILNCQEKKKGKKKKKKSYTNFYTDDRSTLIYLFFLLRCQQKANKITVLITRRVNGLQVSRGSPPMFLLKLAIYFVLSCLTREVKFANCGVSFPSFFFLLSAGSPLIIIIYIYFFFFAGWLLLRVIGFCNRVFFLSFHIYFFQLLQLTNFSTRKFSLALHPVNIVYVVISIVESLFFCVVLNTLFLFLFFFFFFWFYFLRITQSVWF